MAETSLLFERSIPMSSDRSLSPSESPEDGGVGAVAMAAYDRAQRSSSQVLELGEVATAAAQAVQTLLNSGAAPVVPPPPPPLPPGWHVKESRSHPGYSYYFHQSTGVCSWQSPVTVAPAPATTAPTAAEDGDETEVSERQEPQRAPLDSRASEDREMRSASGVMAATPSRSSDKGTPASTNPKRRPGEDGLASSVVANAAPSKRPRLASDKPKQVRILHILKKHKDSRRPSSWRQPNITISKEEAREELKELQTVLQEESGDNLRATFEELARTESDCSSAKRGGDLGFFGPKKMQPAFEEASFALEIGELSGLVETSSGVHILLRIG